MTEYLYSTPSVCENCGGAVRSYLTSVEDQVHGVKGDWDLVRCCKKDCSITYLDAHLTDEDIASFYTTYSTHSGPVIESSGIKRFYRDILASICNKDLGYSHPVGNLATVIGRVLSIIPFFEHAAKSRAFWLPVKPSGKIVEIGFGNAQALLQLQMLGWDVSGVEYDTVCVDQARARGLNVTTGDFRAQNYQLNTQDAVVGSHVIEHVPSPKDLVHEIWNALQPGGIMVLVTPNGNSFGSSIFGKHWRGLETPRHLTIQTSASLAAYAKEAGFKNISVFGTPNGGFILQQSLELALKQRPSSKQGLFTIPFNILASIINIVNADKSEEIVLYCVK